jgi:hypothetical protein
LKNKRDVEVIGGGDSDNSGSGISEGIPEAVTGRKGKVCLNHVKRPEF